MAKKISEDEYTAAQKRKAKAKKDALAKMKGKSTKLGGGMTAWSPTAEELKNVPAWMKKPQG